MQSSLALFFRIALCVLLGTACAGTVTAAGINHSLQEDGIENCIPSLATPKGRHRLADLDAQGAEALPETILGCSLQDLQ